MYIGTVTQQPADKIDYDIDCSDLCQGGDSVASVTDDTTPAGLTVTTFVGTSNKVKVWISDGISGATYKVQVTVTTTLGRIKQDEIRVKIKEI